ncbi:permease for cytosine/purines, uracil, thiamine, allantoin-domain-containing protein [Mycena rebaudengoi]|nr:permease for cytosine/purines, uracil, thiamine, allantoin-domain-containing protein [Mycena rebaudengoi]
MELHDIEKAATSDVAHALTSVTVRDAHIPTITTSSPLNTLKKWNAAVGSLSGFEARGISRVPPDERQPPSLWDDVCVALLWFSANISVNNLAVGLFGPLVFGLGFLDSAMCAVFGGLLGALSTAYMSIWGPQSGNRTMVVLRYFMGYWPAKIPTLLNIVLMVGYCTIDAIIAGQMLSAINGGGMSIVVGIIVVQIVSSIVTVFGMKIFQYYERFSWIPQALVLFILIGSARPFFDTSVQSTGSPPLIAANRLSFFSLCIYVPNSWGAAASDFYVYYPENTSKLKIFTMTLVGLWLSFTLVYLLGIGFATGIASNAAWSEAYNTSIGALIVSGYGPLNGFGRFCAVIVALGVISNLIPGIYSAALGCQVLGRYGKAVPRWVWSCVLIIIVLVIALAGRQHLLVIIQNFVSLMGYWIEFMVFIVLVEHLWFRRRRGVGFEWSRWEDKSYLPIGLAALMAFLMGWVGAILGMFQVWYTGPIASISGPADVGMWIGTGFTIVVYAPLRWAELKYFGR